MLAETTLRWQNFASVYVHVGKFELWAKLRQLDRAQGRYVPTAAELFAAKQAQKTPSVRTQCPQCGFEFVIDPRELFRRCPKCRVKLYYCRPVQAG